jgi:hypothetical protein
MLLLEVITIVDKIPNNDGVAAVQMTRSAALHLVYGVNLPLKRPFRQKFFRENFLVAIRRYVDHL